MLLPWAHSKQQSPSPCNKLVCTKLPMANHLLIKVVGIVAVFFILLYLINQPSNKHSSMCAIIQILTKCIPNHGLTSDYTNEQWFSFLCSEGGKKDCQLNKCKKKKKSKTLKTKTCLMNLLFEI